MADNYVMTIDEDEEIPVRLVGLIDNRECEAFLNTEGAEKKVATSPSFTIDARDNAYRKRFVMVVREKSKALGGQVPHIFISSVITHLGYGNSVRTYYCDEGEKQITLQFKPIKVKADT